jgi:hypothetical protein
MMKQVSIDLAESSPCGCDMPCAPVKDSKWYPSLHIASKDEIELPEEGRMIVTFKRERMEEVTDERGTRYNCTLKIHSIEGVEGAKKQSKRPDEDFDDAMEEYEKSKKA